MEIFKNKLIMVKEDSFNYNHKLTCSTDAVNFIRNIIKLQHEPEETLMVIGMDSKNNIVGFAEVSRGSLNEISSTGREIFKRVVLMNCNGIILAHNHPTGDSTPSNKDIETTKKMQEIALLFNIKLVDHLIIGDKEYYSIIERLKGE